MYRRRTITTAALAATLALPAAAGAQDTSEKDCLKFDSKDKSALTYEFKGNVLTLNPREPGEFLRVKTSKRRSVEVVRKENTYTFDLPKVEGETFTVTKLKSSTGKLRLRVNVLEADGDKLSRFDVRVKAYDEVVCDRDEDDDDKSDDKSEDKSDDKSRGRGRGPESEEVRKSRTERGEGRGPESDDERDDRKDDDKS